ncbi:MAG: nucleotide sugar dehydrogenase [Cyanobacteria bacterium HKST-UBA04]|nr:nucleotide sugar dehydrogenase [Cyanobacteria bacterium HKST-UBA04]
MAVSSCQRPERAPGNGVAPKTSNTTKAFCTVKQHIQYLGQDQHVCVVGLGYVGLTLAITLAKIGFHVTGIEKRADIVAQLKAGHAHFYEPDIDTMLQEMQAAGRLDIYQQLPDDSPSTVYIITVGTPLGDNNKPRMDFIEAATTELADKMPDGSLIVLRSTVKLGTSRHIVAPILEASGKSFHLAFCPERTTEGKALQELRYLPQIVSGYNFESLVRASELFQFITPIVIKVSELEVAEMVKMVDNTQRDLYFAYANEVASLCDAAGIPAGEVINAGNFHYPRNNMPSPGLVGGPCLSKDSYLLMESMAPFNVYPKITMAARHINEEQPAVCARFIKNRADEMGIDPTTISILGLAFKGAPETDDLRGTTATFLIDELRLCFPNAALQGYDAVVSAADIEAFGLKPVQTIEQAFNSSRIVVIHNNHQSFRSLPLGYLSRQMQTPSIIYDFWNLFDHEKLDLADHVLYASLGNHCATEQAKRMREAMAVHQATTPTRQSA